MQNDFKKQFTGVFLKNGVQLGTQGTVVLGPQCRNITSDNTWATPYTHNTTVDANTMNPTNITNTKFVIRTVPNGNPYNAPINGTYISSTTTATQNGGIINISAQGCHLDQNCYQRKKDKDLVLKEELVKNQISFVVNDASSKWINKALIYEEVLNDDSLLLFSSVLQQFKDSADLVNLGTLHQIQSTLADSLKTPQSLSAAITLNANVTSYELAEITHQQVNQIALQAALADTLLTTAQVNDLRTIAMLCPQTHGAGVYRARAIVNYYDAINTHYVSACEQVQSTSNSGNNGNNGKGKSYNKEEQVVISPNPSTGALNIEVKEVAVKLSNIKVLDVFGREVRNYEVSNLNTNSINIEKTGLSKGLYFVQTNFSSGEQQSTKWLIIEE